jgi:sugar lactone lactonase YvrE
MKKTTTVGACLLVAIAITSHAQTINTIAGQGYGGYSGDGGPSTASVIGIPLDVKVDAAGNVYFVDNEVNVVRKINTSGIISTVAGDGYGYTTMTGGFSGDGGLATKAEMYAPYEMAIDNAGNIYISDAGNKRVRKVNTSGIITTFAGNGTNGSTGNGGQATAAEISPEGIAVDAAGNVYITDVSSQTIRKVNTSGVISLFAGGGSSLGDGGPATAATFNNPSGMAFDAAGNLYIADYDNDRIRKISTSGIITTVAGTGVGGYIGDGGPATNAQLWWPQSVAIDASNNIYIADNANNVIREVYAATGKIATIAGNGYGSGSGIGAYSGDGGPATAAELSEPAGVAVSSTGMVYIADAINNRVRAFQGIVGINEITDNYTLSIYPVPTSGIFNITLQPVNNKAQIKVYNLLGESICEAGITTETTRLDISSRPTGVYIYRITDENGNCISTGKIIKE